ncbi:MAG TPA: hypothetical protein VI670_14855 [Thermoanaerobaculia bacterium]
MENGRGIALPGALIAASVAARLAQLQWLHPLQWDEVEYFRATDWVRQGLVPYRDFWEHHTPLQWFLFAPVTALVHWPGVASIIALRWAQLPLWIAAFALLASWMRHAGIPRAARWCAMALALTSSFFMLPAVEYRVDVLAGTLMLLGLVLLQRARFAWAGAAFALAGFANLRFGPVVVVAMLAALWFYGRRAAWSIAGAAAATAAASLYFAGTHSAGIAFRRVFTENALSDRLQQNIAGIFVHRLLAPFGINLLGHSFSPSGIDPAGILLIVLTIVGLVRGRGELRFLAIVGVVNLLFIARMKFVFNYHFEIAVLLALPLVAVGAHGVRPKLIAIALVAATIANVAVALFRGKEADLQYQDLIMREADRRTPPGGRVFDSVGWALHRKPAYEYWFLRHIVFELESRRVFATYVPSPPPDAIIADHDTRRWLVAHPSLRAFVAANYVPVGRDLWLPRARAAGMAPIPPSPPDVSIDAEAAPRWHVPRLGYNAAPR